MVKFPLLFISNWDFFFFFLCSLYFRPQLFYNILFFFTYSSLFINVFTYHIIENTQDQILFNSNRIRRKWRKTKHKTHLIEIFAIIHFQLFHNMKLSVHRNIRIAGFFFDQRYLNTGYFDTIVDYTIFGTWCTKDGSYQH